MQLQESFGRIYLNNGTATFQCPLSEFVAYEPDYVPVSAPYIIRFWDTTRQYVNDGGNAYGDTFFTPERFAYFLGKLSAYQAAYDAAHVVVNPTTPNLYATLAFFGGDGKSPIIGVILGHTTKGTMNISGDLRLSPTTPGLPVNINFEWRVTLRKVVSEFATTPIDSFPVDGCAVVNNAITWTGFNPETLGMSPGVYLITDEDFATIPGAAFGLSEDYQVKLVGGNKYFKVMK